MQEPMEKKMHKIRSFVISLLRDILSSQKDVVKPLFVSVHFPV